MAAEIVAFTNAVVVPKPADPLPEDGSGDGKGKSGPPQAGLPEDCPVTPLGMSADGKMFFYLDSGFRLCVLREKDHSRLGILALFNQRWGTLQDYWPRLTKVTDKVTGEAEYIPTGWKPERAAEELIGACGRRGTLNIADRVRGPGAWRGSDGELILHCGDRVLVGSTWRRPGEISGNIYPANAPTPLPFDGLAAGGSHGPGAEALAMLQTWGWKRPEVDPVLLLGALGAAKIGGALKWRPTIWLTGDFGAGKSTLLELFAGLCGEGGAHSTVDATPAGIWQRTRQSSHPVLVDEAEAEHDPRRIGGMIKLARAASSGGVVYRGGSEHAPVHFVIQACFLFGSILVPGLTPQDRSRIAVLELEALSGTKPPALAAVKLKALGEALTRRMVDGWTRLPDVLERYRAALLDGGHRARGADQYGTLLACADLLLHDHEVDNDSLALWAELLPAESDAQQDHEQCLAHLLTAIVDPYRGGSRRTIAQWLDDARLAVPEQPSEANRVLETYGLSVEVVPVPTGMVTPERWLYVANQHRGLAQLFEGSHWAGLSGTSAPWVQALRRVPDSERVAFRRFAGYPARATRLPLDALLGDPPGAER